MNCDIRNQFFLKVIACACDCVCGSVRVRLCVWGRACALVCVGACV